jgi:cold shock CspA family protein
MLGRVTHWNYDKGFGFIRPEAGDTRGDVFLHAETLGDREPAIGDTIEFETQINHRNGKIRAATAKIIAR